MTETKWTPGPWAIERNSDDPTHATFSNSEANWWDFASCVVRMEGRDDDNPEGVANAHLIAAAPDLYEALDEIATELAGILNALPRRDDTEGSWRTASVALDVAMNAMAKARGEK